MKYRIVEHEDAYHVEAKRATKFGFSVWRRVLTANSFDACHQIITTLKAREPRIVFESDE